MNDSCQGNCDKLLLLLLFIYLSVWQPTSIILSMTLFPAKIMEFSRIPESKFIKFEIVKYFGHDRFFFNKKFGSTHLLKLS